MADVATPAALSATERTTRPCGRITATPGLIVGAMSLAKKILVLENY